MFITANPEYKTLTAYNSAGQKVLLREMFQKEEQTSKQEQKPAQNAKQEEKVGRKIKQKKRETSAKEKPETKSIN